jgi:glycosyltransferase involved in cell wall biosynthesis
MKIVWVTRSFLDYRIPVFKALDKYVHGQLFLIYSGDYVPLSVQKKAEQVLGWRSMPMTGEWTIGGEDSGYMANQNVSFRFHPGVFSKIRELKPDVIVCDGFFKWTLPALFYKFCLGTPIVICYERWHHTEMHSQWYRKLYRKMVVRFTNAMCCNGRLSKEYTISLGMPGNKITTGHMVADTEGLAHDLSEVSEEQKQNIIKKYCLKDTIFLYVGRLIEPKGIKELLEGWYEVLSRQNDRASLLLVGDGPQKEELEQFCQDKQITNVCFAGRVDYDDIAQFYSIADIFVIPTLEDNWSLVVPEAMACGLPVLCSKYNGCWPELVQEEKNGWVFDPLEHSDTKSKLLSVLEQKERFSELGENSKKIIARHNPEKAANSIWKACQNACKCNRKVP